MPHTLLLRLEAPIQSWGIESRFEYRETMLEPTFSGVIGLCCAALGRDRHEPVNDLTEALQMAVRIDRQGFLQEDFHTAMDVITANGSIKPTQLSYRWYLHNASFLVGLQSADAALLHLLHQALLNPHWLLFLGRKSCPPTYPVVTQQSFREGMMISEAFISEPLRLYKPRKDFHLRIIADIRLAEQLRDQNYLEVAQYTRNDVPISFAKRVFTTRMVTEFEQKISRTILKDCYQTEEYEGVEGIES